MNPLRIRFRTAHRKAVSVTELLVAMGLLAVLTSAIGQYVVYVNKAIRSRELFRTIHWELDSARELIGSWHPVEVSFQRIASIPFSQRLHERLQEPAWSIQIEPAQFQGANDDGIRNVRLAISGIYLEQKVQPIELSFWISDVDQKASQSSALHSADDSRSQVQTESEQGD